MQELNEMRGIPRKLRLGLASVVFDRNTTGRYVSFADNKEGV